MAASPREKVMLLSTGKTKLGKLTRTAYYSTKNKRNTTDKIKIKKYDPRAYNPETGKLGLHVVFEEKKVPK